MVRAFPAAVFGVVLALFLVACGGGGEAPVAAHRGPILLITVEGLRADAVGALGGRPGLTPHLDRLAAGADWAGSAIAPSSAGLPALASLWTGLKPWQHQAIVPRERRLGDELVLLPEALAAVGYRGLGFEIGGERLAADGYDRALSLHASPRLTSAVTTLRRLDGGRRLVWVHFAEPTTPYLLRREFVDRLEAPVPELPARLGPRDLEPYFDPEVALPATERSRIQAMYELEVAWLDHRIGRLLTALEASGQAPGTLVAVVSAYGQELGEHGQVGAGGNLGRASIEVPMIVDLPAGLEAPPGWPPGEPVAATRLWATLVEATGGEAPPGVAPSLFRPVAQPMLSELYRTGGYNETSLVEGDLQLRRRSRYADAGEYFEARLAGVGIAPDRPLAEPPQRLFSRLGRAYWETPPFTGDGSPAELVLERWVEAGVEAVDDPPRQRAMAVRLEAAWHRFVDRERSPSAEVAARAR